MTLADILRLIAAVDDPTDHLTKVFEWRVERAMTSVRLTTAAAAGILASLVAALLRSSGTVAGWVIAVVSASVMLGLAYAWSRYDEARMSEREYVVALNLIRELKPLTPLIRLSPDLNVD
jgi:hypothetical protein